MRAKRLIIIVDGEYKNIPHKRIRVDALFEKLGLDPSKERLALVDPDRHVVVEYCCLHDVIELFPGMCFTVIWDL